MTKRRGAGEGSRPRLRADGRYEIRLSLGQDVGGKRLQKSIYGATQRECIDNANEAKHKLALGIPLPSGKLRLADFASSWLEHRKGRIAESTWESYEATMRLHVLPFIGHIPIGQLTALEVQEMMTENTKAGDSAAQVAYNHRVLKIVLGHGEKLGACARNVAKLVTPPKVDRQRAEPIQPAKVKTLLKFLAGHRLETLITGALALGLRRGEALGLQWADFDFKRGYVKVSRQLRRIRKKGLALVRLKTEKSRRELPLSAKLKRVFLAHQRRQDEERALAGSKWTETGLVFVTSKGGPLDPRNVYRDFLKVLKDAKLEDHRFHDLRHTFASLMAAEGEELEQIKMWLGHSQIALTADLYTHFYPSVAKQTARRLDKYLIQ